MTAPPAPTDRAPALFSRAVRLAAAAAITLLAAGSGGCSYARNRLLDLSDIISIGAGEGSGIGIRAEATRLVSLDLSAFSNADFFDWSHRSWTWEASGFGLPFSPIWSPWFLDEKKPERGIIDYFSTSHHLVRYGWDSPRREDRRWTMFIWSGVSGQHWIDALDVQVTAAALIGSVDFAIRPGQLLDFLAGFFLLDPAGDDVAAPAPEPGPDS